MKVHPSPHGRCRRTSAGRRTRRRIVTRRRGVGAGGVVRPGIATGTVGIGESTAVYHTIHGTETMGAGCLAIGLATGIYLRHSLGGGLGIDAEPATELSHAVAIEHGAGIDITVYVAGRPASAGCERRGGGHECQDETQQDSLLHDVTSFSMNIGSDEPMWR